MNIIGTGLNCLDIIHKKKESVVMNGGTCANVITILAQMGWGAKVLIPDYTNDDMQEMFLHNYLQLGVEVDHYCSTNVKIPRILEEYEKKEHVFYTQCPQCSKLLLTKRYIMDDEAKEVFDRNQDCDIFFFDRVSSGIRALLDLYKEIGIIAIYEPNSARNSNTVLEIAHKVDIIKFSSDKISETMADRIKHECENTELKLIVMTKGEKGILFAYKMTNGCFSEWIEGPYKKFENVVDTSGAGDWLTAGMLYYLFQNSKCNQLYFSEQMIFEALKQALELSFLEAQIEGAQGIFYSQKLMDRLNSVYEFKNRDTLKYYTLETSKNQCGVCTV